MRMVRDFGGGDGGMGWRVRFERPSSRESLRLRFLPFDEGLVPSLFPSPAAVTVSSSRISLPLAFRRPWPFRFTYTALSSPSGRALLGPCRPDAPLGPGSAINSLLSTPRLALAFDARSAGTTLLMMLRACLARISLRIAGGARPWDFSVRPILTHCL